MKTKIIALALLAGSSVFAQSRFSIGVQVGGYPQAYPPQGYSQGYAQGYDPGYDQGYAEPAPAYAAQIPPCPGPDFEWIDGYWSQNYGRRVWIAGLWRRRAFERPAYGFGYVAPRRDFERREYRPERRENFSRGYESNHFREESRGRDNNRDHGRESYGNSYRHR